jgi:hypothetical protein
VVDPVVSEMQDMSFTSFLNAYMSHCVSKVQEKSFYVLQMIDSTCQITFRRLQKRHLRHLLLRICMSHDVSEVQEASLTFFK